MEVSLYSKCVADSSLRSILMIRRKAGRTTAAMVSSIAKEHIMEKSVKKFWLLNVRQNYDEENVHITVGSITK